MPDKFIKNMKDYYEKISKKIVADNEHHNDKLSDYWDIFLNPIIKNPDKYTDKFALDFGSGGGRNIINLLKNANFKRVDGVDISEKNVIGARDNILNHFSADKFNVFINNGNNIPALDKTYDLVTSFAVLQHIPSYNIRFNILTEIYRVLKNDGEFFLHMIIDVFDGEEKKEHQFRTVDYFAESLQEIQFNGLCDAVIGNLDYIKNDLIKIGFKNIQIDVRENPADFHKWWIYIKAEK